MTNEYFKKDEKGELVLVSNEIEYKITFATINGIEYFYQYPSKSELEKGGEIERRRVADISDSLPK